MPETNPPADPMIVRLPLIRFYRVGEKTVGEVVGSTPVPPGMLNGQYLGPNGYTPDVDEATDFRGEPGAMIVEGETVEVVGPTGPPGVDGKSAYQLWLEAGNVGSQATFLASLVGPVGGEGPRGYTGEVGPRGETGIAGVKGDTGLTGARGEKGEKGEKGDAGPKGETGSVGPKGETGAAGQKGDTGAKGDTGSTGPKGDTGSIGPAGPSGAVFLPNISLTDTAIVALLAGTRKSLPIACTGAQVGDRLTAHPFQGTPAGYGICDCYCLVANQVIVTYNGPQLLALASNTIPLKITAFR